MSMSIFTAVNKNWQLRPLLSGLLKSFDFADFIPVSILSQMRVLLYIEQYFIAKFFR